MNQVEELHDLRALFKIQQGRMEEATALWRAEDWEARKHVLPDLGDLLAWLMGRGKTLAERLAVEPDLNVVARAIERERRIRDGMARTGEGREVVTEFIDAHSSMDQEAVLGLTDGEPTTLVDALRRYVEQLNVYAEETGNLWPVTDDLAAILNYPWSGEEERVQLHEPNSSLQLHVDHPDEVTTRISIGSNRWFLFSASREDHAPHSMLAIENAARAVHRAVLGRVIADREHIVQLNGVEAKTFYDWLGSNGRGGSLRLGHRLTVEASGGGVWICTRPYAYQRANLKQHREMDDKARRRIPATDPADLPTRGRWSVASPTLHGIRGHLPMTEQEAAERRRMTEEYVRPITEDQLRRAIDGH